MIKDTVKILSCPDCGSKDNLREWPDGHQHCFTPTCKRHTYPRISLASRGITNHTALMFSVQETDDSIIFPFFALDRITAAYKLRKRNSKTFFWDQKQNIPTVGLFGQHLFPASSSKQITITEGEFDTLSVYQMLGNYPVVSLKNGASGAVKEIAAQFEYINSFDTIVLCFDNDIHGQEAATKVAGMFAIGKVRIVKLQLFKDANDYLINDRTKEFVSEWWKGPIFSPSGLKLGSMLWDEVNSPKAWGVPYPWPGLNELTYGIRKSELVVITADTGIGKTTFVKEIEYSILKNTEDSVGFIHLEEPNGDTALGLMSIAADRPLHLPGIRNEISDADFRSYFDTTINTPRVVIWDHFGSNDIYEVLAKIRHMHNLGCNYIFLDHLSIIVSNHVGDERKQLDEIATEIKTLCMELNIAVIAVIHQNRQGQIRGTAGVEQLANIVIKMYRDHEADDAGRRLITKIVVQKNRFSGRTGPACYLCYDPISGRLIHELTKDQILEYEDKKPIKVETQW